MSSAEVASRAVQTGTPAWAVAPFVAYLLSIAALPLFLGHFWEKNRNKLIFALALSAPVIAFLLGRGATTGGAQLLRTGIDYVGFMALLGALFTITGNVCLSG